MVQMPSITLKASLYMVLIGYYVPAANNYNYLLLCKNCTEGPDN